VLKESVRAFLACLLLGLLAACAAKQSAHTPADPYAALLADMRHGGYVLYLRHAETATASESVVRDFTDCSWQRNLSDQGREQAAILGEKLREQGVAMNLVEASPFCRTRETAELVFGRAPTVNRDLYYHTSQSLDEIAATTAKLRVRLGEVPPRGTNLALVGHAPMMRDAGKVELPEGQGAIVKPNGDGTFRVVARLSVAGISPQ
jgi:phosphohistidine phosphatase SixA